VSILEDLFKPKDSEEIEKWKVWKARNYNNQAIQSQIMNSLSPLASGGIGQAALQALQAYQGYTGYTLWSSPYPTDPTPKTYPESSAAAAGFAAGIKHALNQVMGSCKDDPEKAKLYETLMASAVKVVLAPEASEELSRRALFLHYPTGWAVVLDIGESTPTQMEMGGSIYYLSDGVSEGCPMAVYRSR
jgi:hypothetical protein